MLIWIRGDRTPDWHAAAARSQEIVDLLDRGVHPVGVSLDERYDLPLERDQLVADLGAALGTLRDLYERRRQAWPEGAEGRYRAGPYWLWVIADALSDNDDQRAIRILADCDIGETAGFWVE